MLGRIFFAFLLAVALPAGATDYTDIWWNPAESGWGVNFAQNGSFIFATFFIYAPNNSPTWYTGQLTQDAAGNFSGPLYATTGPWFGTVPFNRNQVSTSQVGNVTFQPAAADTGVLTYNVAAVQVVTNIMRQTLAPVAVAGNYVGGAKVTDSHCTNATDNASASGPTNLIVTQNTGQIQFTLDLFGTFSCTFAGPATQTGQLLAYPAVYTCSDGFKSTATVYELRATSLGIEGRWSAPDVGGGCREDGQFAGTPQ